MASTATKQHYDVVIVGGAMNGSATAYFLASNPDFTGSVLVVERDWTYAQSATALSSSSIRVQFSNPINIQISRFGAQFIRDFPELMAVNGDRPDLAFKENGYLFLADQKGFDVLKRLHQTQLDNGADVTLLDTEALIRRCRSFANGRILRARKRGARSVDLFGRCRRSDVDFSARSDGLWCATRRLCGRWFERDRQRRRRRVARRRTKCR